MLAAELTQNQNDTVFSFSRQGDAAVVTLACPAVREWQASVLAKYLSDVIENNRGRTVIVDVAGIGQFSCAWLNTLIELTDRVERMGGKLLIAGMPRDSRRLLKSTGLARRLHLTGSTSEALVLAGVAEIAPWRMAVAKMLSIPVQTPTTRRAA
jgi:anti-anti-sigma factor